MNKQQIKELIQEIKHSSIPLKSQEILITLAENQLAADKNAVARLTFENKDGTWGIKGYDIKKVPNELYGAICKLRDYERIIVNPQKLLEVDEIYSEICKELAELKKKLPPCYIGDTIYFVIPHYWTVFECQVKEIYNNECGETFKAKVEDRNWNTPFRREDIGRTIFLTKADLESFLEKTKAEEQTPLKVGDKVVMNDKYYVPDESKGQVFTVISELEELCGTMAVYLDDYKGLYPVDGLTKVDE